MPEDTSLPETVDQVENRIDALRRRSRQLASQSKAIETTLTERLDPEALARLHERLDAVRQRTADA